MADFYSLFLESGSIKKATDTHQIRAAFLPTEVGNVPSTYITLLPDPNFIQTQSADITNASSATSSSLLDFTIPSANEVLYYIFDSLNGLSTTAAGTGVRIGIEAENPADSMYTGKVASTTTGFTIANQGTADAFAFVLPGSMAAANVTYPGNIKGFFRNTTNTGSFRNTLLLQSETANQVRSISGSYLTATFIGYSSSLQPITGSYGNLTISASYLDTITTGNLITQSILPATKSLWLSQSLAATVSTTSNATYSTVFTLSGLTNGRRYLVQFYLIARSAATTTGFRCRAINGSNYLGSIYIPTSATAHSITNSSDGNNITNIAGGSWPTANADRLVYGEFMVTKAAGTDPQIQIISEINGSAVTAGIGSLVLYKPIDAYPLNQELISPLTLYSGSIISHTIPSGSIKGDILKMPTFQLPTFSTSSFKYELLPEDRFFATTSTTAQNVTDLQLVLQNSSNYLVVAYMGGSSASNAVGFRSGVNTANASVIVYSTEIPASTTAITLGNNQASSPTTSPASNIDNYYLIKTISIVRTAATGTPTWTPTIFSETGGTVRMGPSVIYYLKY
jgi:hypothetical protein